VSGNAPFSSTAAQAGPVAPWWHTISLSGLFLILALAGFIFSATPVHKAERHLSTETFCRFTSLSSQCNGASSTTFGRPITTEDIDNWTYRKQL
jgi:hypothetical protein